MKLLLTSAGFENPKVGKEFLKLVDKPASQIKVIFIPTASRTKEELFYVGKSRRELKEVGIKKENVKDLNLDHKVSFDEVKDFDVIYVCGGNTFYLLSKVRESGFDNIVKKFLDKGGVYVGASAGSMITTPSIESSDWKDLDRNDIGLTDLTGLDFVPFMLVVHYESAREEGIKEEAASSKYPVRILTDKQAILVKDTETKLIGPNEIKL